MRSGRCFIIFRLLWEDEQRRGAVQRSPSRIRRFPQKQNPTTSRDLSWTVSGMESHVPPCSADGSPLICDATHAEHPLSQTLCVPSLKPQAYVRVLDMNEHRPVFLKPLYEVRVHARSCRFSSQFRECWRGPRVGFHQCG